MTKKHSFGTLSVLAALLMSSLMPSCNSDDSSSSYNYNTVSYASTAVTAFSLASNAKLLNNLDSIYFSIDLTNARIFNATPLPYETNISALLLKITTSDCSVVELNFTTKWGNDTTVDYLKNETDSINFADGPVILHVKSADGTAQRDYQVTVNVYAENPDTLQWVNQADVLPGSVTAATVAKTVQAGDVYYSMTTDGTDWQLTTNESLFYFDRWTAAKKLTFGAFTPRVETLTGSPDGTLYILGDDNMLYSSVDGAATWTSTGTGMDYIFGSYKNSVLGCIDKSGTIYSVEYPGGQEIEQPADFPRGGTSQLITNNSSWEVNPLGVMCGGVQADGSLSGDTWGFDGTKWAKLSASTLDAAQGRSIFKYNIAETDTANWRVKQRPVIIALGGIDNTGAMITKVHYTVNMGVNWNEAPADMQLPDDFPQLYGAQIMVEDDMLTVESRAVKPVTEWFCPFIYLYGGYDSSGVLNTTEWQGVLNRYTLVPLE